MLTGGRPSTPSRVLIIPERPKTASSPRIATITGRMKGAPSSVIRAVRPGKRRRASARATGMARRQESRAERIACTSVKRRTAMSGPPSEKPSARSRRGTSVPRQRASTMKAAICPGQRGRPLIVGRPPAQLEYERHQWSSRLQPAAEERSRSAETRGSKGHASSRAQVLIARCKARFPRLRTGIRRRAILPRRANMSLEPSPIQGMARNRIGRSCLHRDCQKPLRAQRSVCGHCAVIAKERPAIPRPLHP